jgi:CDP-diacylglycerol--glycerol-3-phosphate 3-phosphatidyltransferase
MQFTVPNLFSLSRLALAPLFVFASTPTSRGIIILIAALTDFIDGWIARRFSLRSRTGEILDPITDKLFALTVVVTLYLRRELLAWHVLLLLARDIYNTAAFGYAKARRLPLRFKSRMSGKVVTTLQMVALLAAVVARPFFFYALAATVIVSLYSMYDYTAAGRRALRGDREIEKIAR